nr:MAG TPA: hypothetical protein [Caudoviricetes sp.]
MKKRTFGRCNFESWKTVFSPLLYIRIIDLSRIYPTYSNRLHA